MNITEGDIGTFCAVIDDPNVELDRDVSVNLFTQGVSAGMVSRVFFCITVFSYALVKIECMESSSGNTEQYYFIMYCLGCHWICTCSVLGNVTCFQPTLAPVPPAFMPT